MCFKQCIVIAAIILTASGCGADRESAVETTAKSPAAMSVGTSPSSTPIVEERVAAARPARPGWPSVSGYSDPNLIVYDKARFDQYLAFVERENSISCGVSIREMTIDDRTVRFSTGLDYENAGHRFHLDHLRRFLRSRTAGTTHTYPDEEALKKFHAWPQYVADVCACVNLIGSACATEALPEIEALLSDRDERIRYAAIEAVGKLGPSASKSIPILIELLETEAAIDVARVLGKIGADAVPALTKKVNLGSTTARIYAIDALGLIGPAAAPAVEELIQAMHEKKDACDRSGYISSYAAESLGHIGDRRAIPHLRQMSSSDNHAVQRISEAAIIEIEGGPRFRRY